MIAQRLFGEQIANMVPWYFNVFLIMWLFCGGAALAVHFIPGANGASGETFSEAFKYVTGALVSSLMGVEGLRGKTGKAPAGGVKQVDFPSQDGGGDAAAG